MTLYKLKEANEYRMLEFAANLDDLIGGEQSSLLLSLGPLSKRLIVYKTKTRGNRERDLPRPDSANTSFQ